MIDPDSTPVPDLEDPPEEPLESEAPPRKGRAREWLESLVFTVFFVLVFTRFVAQATQVPTESMKPTIMVGDHFFLDKLAFPANYPAFMRPYLPERSIERGDIVAFRVPGQSDIPFVKRIVGVPGDALEIRDKTVLINGHPLEESYKIHVDETVYRRTPGVPEGLQIRDNYGPVTLPEEAYFAMGDNRDNSNDSRYWGVVSKDSMIGKPLFIYWSYEADPYVPGPRPVMERLQGYLSIGAHFFSRTRWFRMGSVID